MSPTMDDDFIYTISDNDEVSDDGALEELAAPKLSGRGKKRKHTEDPDLNIKPKEGSRKKAKKGKKGKKVEVASDEDEEDDFEAGEDVKDNDDMASDFEFQVGDVEKGFVEEFDGWGMVKTIPEKKSTAVDIDDIIDRLGGKDAEKSSAETDNANDPEALDGDFEGFGDDDDELLAEDGFGMGVDSDEAEEFEEEDKNEDEDEDEEEAAGESGSDSDQESVAAHVPHPMDLEPAESESEVESEDDEAVEARKAAAFFAPEEEITGKKKKKSDARTSTFQAMSLSRPILKGLASVGFTDPTPIQSKTIPIALAGKDVVGGAVTGSGKTAAFLIPIMERLLYRPKKVPTTRVAILMPTRELAVQCFNVAQKLSAFTDITFAQIAGGFSLREQEAVLKTRPDVVIATPGRFIDHMHNSASFQVDTLEILVLDEADRMLEEGFESQLNEILTTIPKSRQTMLFSATMTSSIDSLVRLGMNRPVRLMVDAKKQTVSGLLQEFIRLRSGKESKRLPYLMYLCDKIYTERVIVFFRQKKDAHRIRVIFALCGLKASELHGNMSQEQRIQSVESFRSGKSSYLLATDVASRGLDIKNVSTVINYEAPQTHEIYLHRVGRTARAGRTGRACTIAAEPDRKVVKAAVKVGREQGAKIVSRQIPAEEVEQWTKKLKDLEEKIEEVLAVEKEERALSITERDLKRGENLIKHEDEIKSRPRRTWFESEKEKEASRQKGAAVLNGPIEGGKKPKGKLSGKDRKKLELRDARLEARGGWKKGKDDRGIKTLKGKNHTSKSGKPGGKPGKGKKR